MKRNFVNILLAVAFAASAAGIFAAPAWSRPDCDVRNPPPICGLPEPLTPIAKKSPTGTFTSVSRSSSGLVVSGTATDPDAPGPVEVTIWVMDGHYVGSVWANGPGGAFSGTVSAYAGNSVCATAINRNQGEDRSLGCRPLTIITDPFGSLDAVLPEPAGIRITGWAIDPDTTAPIDVHVYVNGEFAQAITAALSNRPIYGSAHGYQSTLLTHQRGRYTVCVYGINVGPGDSNTELGCKTVTQDGPPGGSLPKAVGDELSLETFPQPGLRVRVSNDVVYIASIDGMTEMDVSDARFRKVPGLADKSCVSFESIKYPGRFLRHENNQLKLHAGGLFAGFSFNDDATFCPHDQRYESFNKMGYYIRDAGPDLVLARVDTWQDPDSTLDTIFFEEAPATLGLDICGAHSWTVEGENDIVQGYGECTGLAPFWSWGTPRTTCTTWLLCDAPPPLGGRTRTVERCATATPIVGWYPWIKFTRRHSGPIFKIETGKNICAF